jgi:hypothetical protein
MSAYRGKADFEARSSGVAAALITEAEARLAECDVERA